MKKFFKYIVYLVIALIIVAIVAAIILGTMVDPDKIKQEITSRVSAQTGRQFAINGEIERSFFPWLGLKVRGVTMSNAPGFMPLDKFLEIGEADVRVKVLPLLSGKVEVGRINLKQVTLNLSKTPSGQTNWDDLLKKQSTQPQTPTQTSKTSATFFKSLSIAAVDVSDAKVTWIDEQRQQTVKFTDVYVNSSNIGLKQSFPVTIKFKLEGIDHLSGQYESSANVWVDNQQNIYEFMQLTIAANLPTAGFPSVLFNVDKLVLDMHHQTLDSPDFVLANGSLKVKGSVHAEQIMDKPIYSGGVEIQTTDLRSFLKALGKDVNPADPKALQHLTLSTSFRGTEHSLKFDPIAVNLDGSAMNGSVNISSFSPTTFTALLSIDQFNLDRYTSVDKSSHSAVTEQAAPGAAANTVQTKSQPAAIDLHPLRDMTVSADIKIGMLTVSATQLSQLHTQLLLEGGMLRIAPFSAHVYDGTVNAQLVADLRTNLPSYTLQQTFANVQLAKLSGSDRLTGIAHVSVELNSRGLDKNMILHSLNGRVQFNVDNGALKGINIPYEIERALALIKKQTPPAVPENNQTDFNQLSGTGTISNGIVANNDLLLQADQYKMTGEGTANLISQGLNYRLRVVGMETVKDENGAELQQERQTEVPLLVTGSFSRPIITPDVAALAAMLLKEKVKKNINENFEQAKEKAGQIFQRFLQ